MNQQSTTNWQRPSYVLVGIGLIGLLELVVGVWLQSPVCLGGGAVAVCIAALSLRVSGSSSDSSNRRHQRRSRLQDESALAIPEIEDNHNNKNGQGSSTPSSTKELIDEMLDSGRFALLLRPQITGNLNRQQLEEAIRDLDERMGLVPTGAVYLHSSLNRGNGQEVMQSEYEETYQAKTRAFVEVEPFFLDQYTVSNKDYFAFVDQQGYEQLAIWDEEALPALVDFVDRTDQPGPRFWSNGCFPEGEGNLPVVGISWYEARAYAKWCGKRLPSDSEWVKACVWPVESSPGQLTQRRFPWGNTFDNSCANIWGTGNGKLSSVDDYPNSASPGGMQQMVGNVWEWTSGSFGSEDDRTLRLSCPMKNIRGGAFNTYFENQATSHFQSGSSPLSRRHNIGFRLAVAVADLDPNVTGLGHRSQEEESEEGPSNAGDSERIDINNDGLEQKNPSLSVAVVESPGECHDEYKTLATEVQS